MIVVGDENLLKVAVSNIIDNGCKYSPDHTVEIKLMPIEKSIEIVFEDRGIGIPETDVGKIFEPFIVVVILSPFQVPESVFHLSAR